MESTTSEIYANSGILELFVLATNLQAEGGIAAWEMGLSHNGPITFLNYQIPYSNLDISLFPNIVVVHTEPLLQAPIIHLMTLRYQVADGTPAEVFFKEFTGGFPAEGGSLNNYLPVYSTGPVGGGDLRNLYPTSGSIDLPVFRVNDASPLATESDSRGYTHPQCGELSITHKCHS